MTDPTPEDVERVALLPCPFCGGAAKLHPDEIGSGGQHVPPYHAMCHKCQICLTREEEAETTVAWNCRAAMPPAADHSALIRELRDALAGMVEFYGDHDDDWSVKTRADAKAALRNANDVLGEGPENFTSAPAADDLMRRLETQIAMDSPRGREVYQEVAAEITRLRAELAGVKRQERNRVLEAIWDTLDPEGALYDADLNATLEAVKAEQDARIEAEAARDRFAAVIAWLHDEHTVDNIQMAAWANEAVALHRAKQEEKDRG